MTIYDELKIVAKEVLTEFNQGVVKLINITPANGPADDPGNPTATPYTLAGAVVRGVGYRMLRNTNVVATDLEVTCNVIDGVTPTENDFIEIDGKRHKIVVAPQIPGAGTRVVWKFVVRSGG